MHYTLKHGIKECFSTVLNLKICDHCREQIRSDKHFPTFWTNWAETLIFQKIWFWNKTWLHIITFWCSWKIQVFWKSSKWYALLNNLNKLVIWYTSRLTIPKIPFRSLIMIIQGYLFHSRLTVRSTLSKSQTFHYPKSSPIWLILFSFDWGNLNHFGPRVPR